MKETPLLTVDAVVLFGQGIVLIRRKNPPYEGLYALPGGFVEVGETVEKAVAREVREETGLHTEILGIIGVYSDPGRDPRGHTVSICYLARGYGDIVAGSDADSAEAFPIASLPDLAFDHADMIDDALELIRSQGSV